MSSFATHSLQKWYPGPVPGEHIGLVILAIVGIICYPVSILSWEPRSVKREIDLKFVVGIVVEERSCSYVFLVGWVHFFWDEIDFRDFMKDFFVAFLKVVMI